MIRVKDAQKSVHFYGDLLGMNTNKKLEMPQYGFSLFFMTHAPDGSGLSDVFDPVIELTHNHGTEDQADFKYHDGNSTANGELQGFGHTGFLVDDLDAACAWLEEQGVPFKKKPSEGKIRNIAFALDPDGYWVEIIQKGAKF